MVTGGRGDDPRVAGGHDPGRRPPARDPHPDGRHHGAHRARASRLTGPEQITGIDINLRDVGELTPVVAAVAALASTPSRLRGIGHLRGHETDRLDALSTRDQPARRQGARQAELAADHPGCPARRVLRDLRRPPDGHGWRRDRPASARRADRRRGHDAQDPAGVHHACGGTCSARTREALGRGRRPDPPREGQVPTAQQGPPSTLEPERRAGSSRWIAAASRRSSTTATPRSSP